eukprot:comp22988_c0_seq1/m.36596 comp22988_c0_seq1/g.36596  ORF comp22988_c0_seq1/g.36596 comp22988_c0_seq1/m.36596 type:complete len:647 (-) comp22988_c0_seq1:242-2182(-)
MESKKDISGENLADRKDATLVDVEMGTTNNSSERNSVNSFQRTNNAGSLSLSWKELGFNVVEKVSRKEKRSKEILRNVNGAVHPGEMMAVMGTSGAGKTTFLNVLSGRNLGKGKIVGEVLLNGERRNNNFRRVTAYVEQDDVLMPNLTVKETFTFNALLRLPDTYSHAEKMERAMDVIRELGLSYAVNTKIGNSMVKGVSGGERKRCAIGLEMITNPKILFLDEPTSGLDSFTAYHVMKLVQQVAHRGRAVVCTIHQPRFNIYELFDKLLLLSKGTTVFYGPADKAIDFFAEAGFPCSQNNNPADHFLDVTTVDSREPELEEASKARNEKLIEAFRSSTYNTLALKEAQDTGSRSVEDGKGVKKQWSVSVFKQFVILWKRAFLNFTRDKQATMAVFFQTLFLAFITGFVFWQFGDDQNSIQNRTGALFFITLNQSFGPMFSAMLLFHNEKPIFLRERAAGAYRVSAYYLAKSFAETPVEIFFPIIFGTITYWMLGLQASAAKFFFFLLTLVTHHFTSQGIGLLLSAATPSIQVGQAVGPVLIVLLMLFGGFYLNSDDIWVGFKWIEYISFITYTFRALVINEFEGLTFTCEPGRCLSTGDQVLDMLGMAGKSKWFNWAMGLTIGIVVRIAAYFFLRILSKPKIKLE